METVEIIIYMSIAFLVGVMILQFIGTIDVTTLYEEMTDIMTGDGKETEFKQVSKEEFVTELINFWENSGMCEVQNTKSVYVQTNVTPDTLNKSYLFNKIKQIGFCSTLQSATYNCGNREHVNFTGEIDLPHVVRFACNTTEGTVRIKG